LWHGLPAHASDSNTSDNYFVLPPRRLHGLQPHATIGPLQRSIAVIEEGIARGLHRGAQLYVSRHGNVLANLSIGEARPGLPMRVDSLNLWLSSTKPVAAVAIAQLWERGLLDLDDRVTRFLPEFAENGKELITVRHLLTHTGGFRAWSPAQEGTWEAIIAEICRARLEPGWVAGQKAGYHQASSWYILGEIVRRVDGRDYSRYVREMIFEPCGMRDSWVGMPPETFDGYGDRIALMEDTTNTPPLPLDVRTIATSIRPGSGGWGPIQELGMFYEMLMNRGQTATGARILSPQSVEAITARQRAGMLDATFKAQIDWGLGFLLNSTHPDPELPYGYGMQSSSRTFGHGGAQSSGGFCDPERRLVVAYVFNGKCGEEKHHERRKMLVDAIEVDIGK
jgi:CubicO group peptidase (beta-lactamase class C family)